MIFFWNSSHRKFIKETEDMHMKSHVTIESDQYKLLVLSFIKRNWEDRFDICFHNRTSRKILKKYKTRLIN